MSTSSTAIDYASNMQHPEPLSTDDEAEEEMNHLKEHAENDEKIESKHRVSFMLGVGLSVVLGFSMDSFQQEPCKSFKGKKNKPTRELLKKELTRRGVKGAKDKKLEELVSLLKEHPLSSVEEKYVEACVTRHTTLVENSVKEDKDSTSSSNGNMTGEDNMRLLHCFLKDGIIEVCRKSQESMDRVTLDARKSSEKLADVYELSADAFNDEMCVPQSVAMEGVHPKLSSSMNLPKREGVTMTAEKVKAKIGVAKPKLNYVIDKHERSGNGAGQRSDDSPDWGKFDIELCVDGDDRQNFLPNHSNDWWLLCWWEMLLECQLLHFTLVKLPDFMKANSEMHSLVSRSRRKWGKGDEKDTRAAMSDNLGNLSDGIKNIASTTLQRDVDNWESSRFEHEMALEDLDPDTDNRKIALRKKRINELTSKIEAGMKRLKSEFNIRC